MKDRIWVLFVDASGGRDFTAELSTDATAACVIEKLKAFGFIENADGIMYSLVHRATGEPVPENQPLVQSGVRHGDVFQIIASYLN